MKTSFLAQLIFLVSIVASSCHTNPPKKVNTDSIKLVSNPKTAIDSDKNDSIAIAQVTNLPEFNNILKWYQHANKDTTRHIAVIIGEEPSAAFKYYWIKVGEDTPDHFVDMEHFYVNTHNLAVNYLDIQIDSLMTIEQWRKSGKDRWQH